MAAQASKAAKASAKSPRRVNKGAAAKLRAEVAVVLHGRQLLEEYLNGATLRELADRMGIADHKTVAGLLKKTIAEFKERFELEAHELLVTHLSHLDSLITQAQAEWEKSKQRPRGSDPRWGALVINALDRKAALLGLGPESMRATELAADLDAVRQRRWAELRDSPMGRLLVDGAVADAFYSDPYEQPDDAPTIVEGQVREVGAGGTSTADEEPTSEGTADGPQPTPGAGAPGADRPAAKLYGGQQRYPEPQTVAPDKAVPDSHWFERGEDNPADHRGRLERASGKHFRLGKRSIGGRR
jgi:hypothetical protein